MPGRHSTSDTQADDDESRAELTTILPVLLGRDWDRMTEEQRNDRIDRYMDSVKRGELPTVTQYGDRPIEESPTEEELTAMATHFSPEGQAGFSTLSELLKSPDEGNDILLESSVKHRRRELFGEEFESIVLSSRRDASQGGTSDNQSIDAIQQAQQ